MWRTVDYGSDCPYCSQDATKTPTAGQESDAFNAGGLGSERYVHDKLPDATSWMRLFRLERRSQDDDHTPIICHIKAWPLAQVPPYRALSYEWGQNLPNNRAVIHIDSLSLVIPNPLHEFLLVLAAQESEHAETWFFADAICLDQSSDTEKSDQIGLMGRIYSEAALPLCWVGEMNGAELYLIPNLISEVSPVDNNIVKTRLRQMQQDFVHLSNREPEAEEGNVDPALVFRSLCIHILAGFVRKSYWSRLWMVQELILPNKIQLYSEPLSFSWDTLESWLPHMHSDTGRSENCIIDLFGLWTPDEGTYNRAQPPREAPWRELRSGRVGMIVKWRKQSTASQPSLYECIHAFGLSACGRPRDRVYGLLGLARTHERKGRYPIDERKDIVTIFYDTLWYCEDDLGRNSLAFARKLWAMLEISPTMFLSASDVDLKIPHSLHENAFALQTYLEEEELLTSLTSPRFISGGFFARIGRDPATFDIRPSDDATHLNIGELVTMNLLYTLHRVHGLTYDPIRRGDILLRIVGSMCGLIFDGRSHMRKGRYTVSKSDKFKDHHFSIPKHFDWCRDIVRLPSLSHEYPTSSRRASVLITDLRDMLLLAADLDGDSFISKKRNDSKVPMGWTL